MIASRIIIPEGGLEFFLIRSLRSRPERKFCPQHVKILRQRVGEVDYEPGDVAVRSRYDSQHLQRFQVFPKTTANFCRGDRSLVGFPFTRMTIESTGELNPLQIPPKPTLAGLKCTVWAEFAPETSLQVVVVDQVECAELSLSSQVILALRSGSKGCILNKNKIQLTDPQGVSTCFVLSGDIRIRVSSFSFADIVSGMRNVNQAGIDDAQGLSFWRPLRHFWTDEAYSYRAVARYVHEHSKSDTSESAAKVHRAVLHLLCGMIDLSQALGDLMTNHFVSVSTELGITHRVITKMLGLRDHLQQLTELRNHPRLSASVLSRLGDFELAGLLPVCEGDFKQFLTEVGAEFRSNITPRLSVASGSPTFFEINIESLADTWSSVAEYIWLRAVQFGDTNQLQGLAKIPVNNEMIRANLKQERQVLTLSQHTTSQEIGGYRAVLFHAMPKFADQHSVIASEVSEFKADAIEKLKNILSQSDCFMIESQKLLCWGHGKGFVDYTSFWFAELDVLQSLLLAHPRSVGTAIQQWFQSQKVGVSIVERRSVDLVSSTAYTMYVSHRVRLLQGIHARVKVIKFSTEWLEQDCNISYDSRELRPQSADNHTQNPFHFGLSYSRMFNMLFFADVCQDSYKPSPREHQTLGITLTAYPVGEFTPNSTKTLSTAASGYFDLENLPPELNYPWEFPLVDNEQGITTSTYNLPFSPLRWCYTRRNAYCI